ncbi:MAG: OmpH family outer membrane protein [Bacteroidota bacterium]
MKNSALLIYNIVLTIAVVILFYLHFNTTGASVATPTAAIGKKIVYVNTDSLLSNYQFYKDTQKEFENKGYQLQVDLGSKERALQNELGAIQQRAQTMTQVELQAADITLKKKGADFQAYSQQQQQKLAEEQSKRVDEIYNAIRDHIKALNNNNKYEYVLGYAKGGGILFADESVDVTKAIVTGLNDSYKSKAPATPAKK